MASNIHIGAHVEQTDPVAEAKARETTLVQFFLGDPQGYKGPEIRYAGGDRGWVGDVPSVAYDTRRIRGLGWSPRLDSEAAVRAAARWAIGQAG